MSEKVIKEGFEKREVYTNPEPETPRPQPESNQPESDQPQSNQDGDSNN